VEVFGLSSIAMDGAMLLSAAHPDRTPPTRCRSEPMSLRAVTTPYGQNIYPSLRHATHVPVDGVWPRRYQINIDCATSAGDV
jgi:hypothetical protein